MKTLHASRVRESQTAPGKTVDNILSEVWKASRKRRAATSDATIIVSPRGTLNPDNRSDDTITCSHGYIDFGGMGLRESTIRHLAVECGMEKYLKLQESTDKTPGLNLRLIRKESQQFFTDADDQTPLGTEVKIKRPDAATKEYHGAIFRFMGELERLQQGLQDIAEGKQPQISSRGR